MWECGLKLPTDSTNTTDFYVTPHVGVWIETSNDFVKLLISVVTPHVGVWIETQMKQRAIMATARHSPCGSVD